MAVLGDLGGLLAEQDVDNVTGAEPLVPLAAQPVHRGQQFLRGDRAVPRLRRRQAGVAVAARFALLAEVAEQLYAAASHRLAEREHRIEVLALPAAVRLIAPRGVDQLSLLNDVLQAVAQPGRGCQA